MLDQSAARILDFLRELGLEIRFAEIEESFLPGIRLAPNRLLVDPARLRYPGDLLHEAGHLAVMPPSRRATTSAEAGPDMGDEIAAQCWSYAAALHLGLSPTLVFHPEGYKGSAEALIQNYAQDGVGVPLLQWMGLTLTPKQAAEANIPPYPHMLRWLRTSESHTE